MQNDLEEYQQHIRMEMEDWLQDAVSRDESSRRKLLGLSVAIVGTRAALNNRVLHSEEYKAVCKLVEDFALADKNEAAALTYFANVSRNSSHLEELSIEILTRELAENDFIQLLDRVIEILEMDGLLSEEDGALITNLFQRIEKYIANSTGKTAKEKAEFISSVRVLVSSILEEVEPEPDQKSRLVQVKGLQQQFKRASNT